MRGFAVLLMAILGAGPASAAEWWHGDYIPADSTQTCDASDGVASYRDKTVEYHETSCTIDKVTNLVGLLGVILNLSCKGIDEEFKQRTLLVKDQESLASFPPLSRLRSCDEPPPNPHPVPAQLPPQGEPVQTGGDCDENLRVYRSPRDPEKQAVSYQELQFTSGIANGTLELTEYRNGKATWRAHGEHTCSNGAVICRVNFPQMQGDPVSLPYEAITNSDGTAGPIVIPSFQQEVYLANRWATEEGKAYGGFVADLLNGFVPAKDEMLSPYNAYWYAGCKAQ